MLFILFIFFLLLHNGLWVVHQIEFSVDYISNQFKERGEDFVKVGGQLSPVNKAKSLPSCENIWLLWVHLLKFRLLNVNHNGNQLIHGRPEQISSHRTGNDCHGFNCLPSQLFVFLACMGLNYFEQQLDSHFQKWFEVLLTHFSYWWYSTEAAFFYQWDAWIRVENKELHHLVEMH